jgi:hypothetical protein
MLKIVGAIAALVGASTFPAGAGATTSAPGTISYIESGPTIFFFNQSGSGTNSRTPASCQDPNLPTRWAIDPTTLGGQSMVATLLSAYSLNKQVVIVGTGSCSSSAGTPGASEMVQFILMIN